MGKSVDIENKKMRKDVNVLPHRTAQPIGILAYWHIDTLLIGTLFFFAHNNGDCRNDQHDSDGACYGE